ncbi:hypothetical protein L6452_37233 [Arctium lappa]|uniref:Uncharacterized protein n=1 Tax=Arctium lappa TaxID=4217 RepID=A0ACB8Y3K6_ARCLA|nr:hypothetical protein L6452_37233 [Arctium lappa]
MGSGSPFPCHNGYAFFKPIHNGHAYIANTSMAEPTSLTTPCSTVTQLSVLLPAVSEDDREVGSKKKKGLKKKIKEKLPGNDENSTHNIDIRARAWGFMKKVFMKKASPEKMGFDEKGFSGKNGVS